MKVIGIINQKGGVGKSMIAVNLAVAYAIAGKSVVIIDTDKQATSSLFRDIRHDREELPQFSAMKINAPTLHKDLKSIAADIVIIDGAKENTDLQRNSMRVSDLIVIPFQPSASDLWSTEDTFKNTLELRQFRPDAKVYAALNLCSSGTKTMEEALSLQTDIARDYDIPFLKSILYRRESYKRAFGEARGILESTDARAKTEFKAFFAEIQKILK
jgi:chromosome partitioning protein